MNIMPDCVATVTHWHGFYCSGHAIELSLSLLKLVSYTSPPQDRSKDIIITGGENVSSIEVEAVLYQHPAVLEAAVVARPDNTWGETVCAFVALKEGHAATMEDIIKFCRNHLPHYMAPRSVVFAPLPKTSTGKVQKFVLREQAKSLGTLGSSKL